MELKGQPAIVTGGASGLGAATARALPANSKESRRPAMWPMRQVVKPR
jgi:hypothetical protein